MKLKNIELVGTKRETSISDNGRYPLFCHMAATDDMIFENFRRDSDYRGIVETLEYGEGKRQLEEILKKDKYIFSMEDWNCFKKNDLYGNPVIYEYDIRDQIFEFSPTTLRYIKILQEILELFDMASIQRIAEIGVGYGGQARIILDYMIFP